ncbi:PrsW family intramembrane metalloprotease [Krasilnikovia sp. M28-CT-15]|uniref:PrsW family intramembrane metalloprotease n=1 Tax=Krasilnikovia sp. M28-CT-15 TaxID=3373540 RepID=UPI00387662EB
MTAHAPVQPGGLSPARLARLPACWIVAGLLVAGGLRIAQIGGRFVAAFPLATLTATVLFGLLAVPFWLFVTELDFFEREPTALLAVALAWGGLVATAVSIPAGAALGDIVAKLTSPGFAAGWGAALTGPTVEEIAKTLGVVAIVLIARSQINSVLDGIVYGAIVGLGFQIVEDIVFSLGAVAVAGRADDVQPVVATFLLRGFLSGVWSHTLFGALAGAGIGYLVVGTDRSRPARLGVALLAVFGAWCAHVLWNAPLFGDGPGNGAAGLLAVLVFKGLPPLLLILLLVRRAHDREADFYTAHLARLMDPGLITPGELTVLRSGGLRAAARQHARIRYGRRGLLAVRRLQRVQARLAVELSRAWACSPAPGPPPATSAVSGEDPGARVRRRCAEVRTQRAVLSGLGMPEAVAPRTGRDAWARRAWAVVTVALAVAVVWAALSALDGG